MSKEKVLILGGGFGGIKAALTLLESDSYEVTLVSDNDEMKYYPNENEENSLFCYLLGGKGLLEHLDSSPKFQDTVKFLENNK